MTKITYTLPSYWASYLINQDVSGLAKLEKALIDKFLTDNKLPFPLSVSDEVEFKYSNDANKIGGDTLEYTFYCEDEIERDKAQWIFRRDDFIKNFSYSEWQRIAQVVHWEEKPETEVTKAATFKLYKWCDRCSNCSGIECAAIYLPLSLFSPELKHI